jgi:hypothetical protein
MKAIPRLLSISLTALALGGVANAQDPSSKTPETRTVYEGLDAQGRIVKVTVSNVSGAQPVAIATHEAQYPQLHWTASIGSGSAAAVER